MKQTPDETHPQPPEKRLDGFCERGAVLSSCGRYRYELWREVDPLGEGEVAFVMLNPSTADGTQDDPTIRRCVNFAKDWGFARLRVVNLFAWRETHPSKLPKGEEKYGPENLDALRRAFAECALIVVGWGSHARYGTNEAWAKVLSHLGDKPLPPIRCLGTSADGSPRHPLMLRRDAALVEWGGGM